MADRLKLKIPIALKTPLDRLAYAYRAQETLRLAYNTLGAEVRAGRKTKADLTVWRQETFAPRSDAICRAIIEERKAVQEDETHQIDIETAFDVES